MRPRDLDLESQGQGQAKVTLTENLQKLHRTINDCDHAECGAVFDRFFDLRSDFWSGKPFRDI